MLYSLLLPGAGKCPSRSNVRLARRSTFFQCCPSFFSASLLFFSPPVRSLHLFSPSFVPPLSGRFIFRRSGSSLGGERLRLVAFLSDPVSRLQLATRVRSELRARMRPLTTRPAAFIRIAS